MTLPGPDRLLAALDRTWPAASTRALDGWQLRDGAGGGKRVSAALQLEQGADIAVAEAALGEGAIFRVTAAEVGLDAALARRGYACLDPTVLMVAPTKLLHAMLPGQKIYPVWPPLAIQTEIWAAGNVDRARLAVMERAPLPKAALLARLGDRVCGAAFVACDGDVAMLHAVEVAPDSRRKGVGRGLAGAAGVWAAGMGAHWLGLAVTEANTGARTLYSACGFVQVGQYKYRRRTG